jgi:hypothetical protein
MTSWAPSPRRRPDFTRPQHNQKRLMESEGGSLRAPGLYPVKTNARRDQASHKRVRREKNYSVKREAVAGPLAHKP